MITGFGSLRIPLTSVVILAIIGGALGFIDARRRNELLFLKNLGTAPSMVVGIWVVAIFVFEMAIRIVAVAAGV
jgi:high-affinity nickel permease